MSFLSRNKIRLIVALILATAVSVIFSPVLVAIIISVGVTYFLLSIVLDKTVFDSIFFRTIVAIVVYAGVLQATTLVAWLINHNFPLDSCTYLALGALIGYAFWQQYRSQFKKSKRDVSTKRLSSLDIGGILIGGLLLAIVTIPAMKDAVPLTSSDFIPSVAVDFVSMGIDDSNHMGMISDRVQFNRGVLYKTDAVEKIAMRTAVNSYPPSWHSINAIIIKAFKPSIKPGGEVILAYVLTKLFWFFILVFCFSRVTTLFLRKAIGDGSLKGASLVWVAGAISFFAYYVLLEQFKEGFYSFIPELIVVLLMGALFIQFVGDRSLPAPNRYRALLPLGILATSGILSWFLVLPALVVSILISMFDASSVKEIVRNFSSVWGAIKAILPAALFLSLAILLQVYLITSGNSRSFSNGVTEPGAITFHSQWYYAFSLSGFFLLISFLGKRFEALRYVFFLVVSLLIFAFFVYAFQVVKVGHADYYFYKTLNTVMVLAIPLAILGWLLLLSHVTSKHSPLLAVTLAAAMVFTLPLAIGLEPLNTSNVGYAKGNRTFTTSENIFFYNDLTRRGENTGKTRTDEILYAPGLTAYNQIGSSILKSSSRISPCHGEAYNAMLADNEAGIFRSIKLCTPDEGMLVIVTKYDFVKQLQKEIDSNGLASKVTIKSIDHQ